MTLNRKQIPSAQPTPTRIIEIGLLLAERFRAHVDEPLVPYSAATAAGFDCIANAIPGGLDAVAAAPRLLPTGHLMLTDGEPTHSTGAWEAGCSRLCVNARGRIHSTFVPFGFAAAK